MTLERVVKEQIDGYGFAVLPALLAMSAVEALRQEADSLLSASSDRGGVRNALRKSDRLAELAAGPLLSHITSSVLGTTARPTKLTIFDKTPAANWKVPFHQDLTISVSHRIDEPGYGPVHQGRRSSRSATD